MSSRSNRIGIVVGLCVVAFVAAVAVLAARGAGAPAAKPTAPAPASAGGKPRLNSCNACLERSPLLDPSLFAGWNDTDVQKAYAAAAKYPATIDLLHCFCECQESPREHHKTLLTCFTSQHAAGCGICQREALSAAKMKDNGASDEEVESTVEFRQKTEGHKPTKGRGI